MLKPEAGQIISFLRWTDSVGSGKVIATKDNPFHVVIDYCDTFIIAEKPDDLYSTLPEAYLACARQQHKTGLSALAKASELFEKAGIEMAKKPEKSP